MAFSGLTLSLVLILLAMGGVLLFRSRSLEQQSGLPVNQIIYSDTGTWHPNGETLYSTELRLAGRPDYLIQQHDGEIVPVELKSGRAPAEPWEGHILQLAAYCLLVEETYGTRPSYGIIQYRDRAFAIDYTADLEDELLELLEEMRDTLTEEEVDRDHNDWRRCAACGLNQRCAQRLG